jgi:Tol biopolymer transport system component/DNA-binding winged helix-turn-helix (wHTH) protein
MPEEREVLGSVRFGQFDLSVETGELRKNGTRLKLSGQAIQVLALLTASPGKLVSREELQQKLWPGTSFGDPEHGLNAAVNRLRETLGDSATEPKYIETLPGRGYRFIGLLQPAAEPVVPRDADKLGLVSSEPEPSKRSWWRAGVVLAIGLALLTVFTVQRFWPRRSDRPQTSKIVPFTSYLGNEGAPSFSPDGNQIVFHWWGDDSVAPGLYIKQLGNEKALQLTDDPSCVVPTWSPDGRSIAFSRWNMAGSGIYIVPSLGGPVRKLVTTQTGCDRFSYLSWSSDSKSLAFPDFDSKVDKPMGAHMYLLNVDTLERRLLPHPSPTCNVSWVPAFSPDGKSLAFACMTTHEIGGIFVEPASGGLTREIVHFEGNIQGIAWASDGQSLVYSLDGSLWRVPASGGLAEQLPRAQHASGLAIARNGERLAYSQVELRQNIWRLNLVSPTKARGAPTKLIASTGLQMGPRISPDGRHIAFESTRSGSAEIWVCDSDGSNPVQMTFFHGPQTGTVRWSPDSSHFVFDSRATGHPQLYVLNADGGPPRLLRTGTPDASEPFWSADGRWIYFSGVKSPAIWKVLADGGNAVRLTDTDGFAPQESVDGARIYFVRGHDRVDVWWVPSSGGSSRRLEGMPTLVSGDHWTPSKHGIYFIDGAADPATLNLFDPKNRHITRVAALSGLFWGWGPGLNVSNDGHTVLYGKGDGVAADIMLIEGFR